MSEKEPPPIHRWADLRVRYPWLPESKHLHAIRGMLYDEDGGVVLVQLRLPGLLPPERWNYMLEHWDDLASPEDPAPKVRWKDTLPEIIAGTPPDDLMSRARTHLDAAERRLGEDDDASREHLALAGACIRQARITLGLGLPREKRPRITKFERGAYRTAGERIVCARGWLRKALAADGETNRRNVHALLRAEMWLKSIWKEGLV